MSKVIPWDDIRPGMTVWEECIWGTGTIRADVKADGPNATHKIMHYTLASGAEFTQNTRRSKEFRYWDEQPTFEEREQTPFVKRGE